MKTLIYIVVAVVSLSFASSCMSGPKEARTENVNYWKHGDKDEWYDGD